MTVEGFHLGGPIDPSTGERAEGAVDYDAADLTTHGVIVGMTGSGKTGLGIIYLEEALLSGVPTLVIDPKGDMTNLLLTFPDLAPADFEPWVDEAEARRAGKDVATLAADTARLWRDGLESWGLDGGRIAELRAGAGFTIYTPGSSAGVPLDIVGSLANPGLDWDEEAETLRDEIQGFVSGLLGLVGIAADPISSREHILVSNIVEAGWRAGEDLDLATLLARVQRPPMRKLGVFEIDTFFPEKDRLALAMQLNGLIASPAFASWMEGPALDVGALLWDAAGKPQASILYLAHLSDEERQFIVTLVLSKVVTWMRRQGGTGDLRALVYMDEVFGFVPPTAEPPAKRPILTLLKQARAFGVGMLLSTQNPVDLDYKAMSNAGTWCVGRLQTERDKARIVEALQSASGDVDVAALDSAISALDKRQFLLHNTHDPEPVIFTTRWALSYLRGPLTRDQIGKLMAGRATPAAARTVAPDAPPEVEAPDVAVDEHETPVLPAVASGTRVAHLDPAAPWAGEVGATTGTLHRAALAVRVRLTFDDTAADVRELQEWEAVVTPLAERLDPAAAHVVDHDARDFHDAAPPGATYLLPEAAIQQASWFRDAATAIKDHLYREARLTVSKNAALKLYSRVGESAEDFAARCDVEAQSMADAETAKLRDKYEARMKTLRRNFDEAQRRVGELEADVGGSRTGELLDGAGAILDLLTGRRSTRSITGSASKRATTRSKEQRLVTAQDKAQNLWQDMADIEQELVGELEEINDRWEEKATVVEDVEIGLEKDDIDVDEITLVWIPVASTDS
jgi:hypothetical protein